MDSCFERSRRLPVAYPKLSTQVKNFVSKSSISHLSEPNHQSLMFFLDLISTFGHWPPTHVLFHGTFAITWEVAMAYNLGVSGLEAAHHNQSIPSTNALGIPNALPIPVFSPNLIGEIKGVNLFGWMNSLGKKSCLHQTSLFLAFSIWKRPTKIRFSLLLDVFVFWSCDLQWMKGVLGSPDPVDLPYGPFRIPQRLQHIQRITSSLALSSWEVLKLMQIYTLMNDLSVWLCEM